MIGKRSLLICLMILLCSSSCFGDTPENLKDENLVAWCIVPFDSQDRSPTERAEMIRRIGLRRVAYDWREKHVESFEDEILQYKRLGIEYFAFWGVHEEAYKLFEKHDLHPQIWQTLGSPEGESQQARVEAAAEQLLPLVRRTNDLGCKLGLYNHGGWGGEPTNMVAVCRYLRENYEADHVGIVYNQHHGHNHIDEFAEALEMMRPFLLCLNLNGMTRDGDQHGKKILPLGEGEFDVSLLKTIRDSDYVGPIGIIGHTQDDVEMRLRDNLDGLHWILPQLDGAPAGEKPELRTYSPEKSPNRPTHTFEGALLENKDSIRHGPITVECRATLPDANGYNILVASDTKASGNHWEIFSLNGKGTLTAYLPGFSPDHLHTDAMICDDKPHTLAMTFDTEKVTLFVDGRNVGQAALESRNRGGVNGKLAIGRLVEGDLGCRGSIEWVRISKGVRELSSEPTLTVEENDATLLMWNHEAIAEQASANHTHQEHAGGMSRSASGLSQSEHSPELVAELVENAKRDGDPARGIMVFANATSSCLSCHQIGEQGGTVGPALTTIGKDRQPAQLVESVIWPQRDVKPEHTAHTIIDISGRVLKGYIVDESEDSIVLRDPTQDDVIDVTIPLDEIEVRQESGTLMPDNLVATMSVDDLHHLLHFLFTLGTDEGVDQQSMHAMITHAMAHATGPATFAYTREPLDPSHWPGWQEHVNRDRIYDFYSKQADHFRNQDSVPPLLEGFPGLDGGELGHWGNQNEAFWADDRWNSTDLGSVLSGVFRGNGKTVPRAVCVRLGGEDDLSACFNLDTLTYDVVWKGGFVESSSTRHGFVGGLRMVGTALDVSAQERPTEPFEYLGFHQIGEQIVFSYRIGDQVWLDAPVQEQGEFKRMVGPADGELNELIKNRKRQWPNSLTTEISLGDHEGYVVDTIGLPFDNPWKSLLFCGGHAFLDDGSALICTMQGDVWRVTDYEYPSTRATWTRFASGLHHPLGMVVDDEGVFVLCRDQITRLHDLNADGEADFYECFSSAFTTSPAGHDFICGLARDAAGFFYTASGNEGLVQITPDGREARVIATGFRNPDGLGIMPDGTITVPCSEGEWTPASMICAIKPEDFDRVPHYGYRGPQNETVPALPLSYLPRGLDNSSGGQVFVESDRWGPLSGQMIHFSFGAGSQFALLRDEIDGQLQGAIVPIPGEFRSGAHRGKVSPHDGQLYVTGMQGWGSYTPDDGCFQRVRYTGHKVQTAIGFHVHENGIMVEFSEPLASDIASSADSHFAQCWNYRYSSAYGSPEFSTLHSGMRGHDTIRIKSVHVSGDRKSLFLELPDLQPVNQLHLRLQSARNQFHDMFVTVHRLDKPKSDLPNYVAARKVVNPHPIIGDLALATRSIPNPHVAPLADARKVTLETGSNLSFKTRSFRAQPGEPIELTLSNPDVVPHNWALLKPGTLERVGRLADRFISDPDAALHHYVPPTEDVLVYTDVVLPKEDFSVFFFAPEEPGRYPFLCTFPGHWKVMNGILIVE